ncbi:MAG TPA: tetratricopeptide repeat protein [Bryobacteraceae bacterium]
MKIRTIACVAALSLAALPALARHKQKQSTEDQQQTTAQQQPKGPHPHSNAEIAALQKVQTAYSAHNWDATIQAINDVLENFPKTEYKPQLLDMAANAAEYKGDYAATITYGQQALQANPQDTSVLVQLAEDIGQHTHDTDLDKAKSIKQVQDYANKALTLLKDPNTQPPPGVPAASWSQMKIQLTSRAYDALGLAAGLDKNYPQEITYLKTSIEKDPSNSVTRARLAQAYLNNKQYDEAITQANQVLAMANVPAQVKQFAQAQKAAATEAKAAAKPAAPAKPATPEKPSTPAPPK